MIGKCTAAAAGSRRVLSSGTRRFRPDLKLTRLSAYRVDLPLHELSYKWAGGKSVNVFDATVVRLETNEGIVGWGEATPLGPNYLPAFAEGIRAGLPVLAKSILGLNPLSLNEINVEMDRALKGHPYIKSAIDVACWDIRGKIAGLPVCELLGGRFGTSFPLYRAISQGTAAEMAANVGKYVDEGYRKFQLKVGGRPRDDIDRIRAVRALLDSKTKELRALGESDLYIPLLCDANTGWQRHEAVQVVSHPLKSSYALTLKFSPIIPTRTHEPTLPHRSSMASKTLTCTSNSPALPTRNASPSVACAPCPWFSTNVWTTSASSFDYSTTARRTSSTSKSPRSAG